MDEEERDKVPGHDSKKRFSFGTELMRITQQIEDMKNSRRVENKHKPASDIGEKLCKAIKSIEEWDLDTLFDSGNEEPQKEPRSTINLGLGIDNTMPDLRYEANKTKLKTTSQFNSVPIPATIRQNEPAKEQKTNFLGILDSTKFKIPEPRRKSTEYIDKSLPPRRASKSKEKKRTSKNLIISKPLSIPQELLLVKPRPPLSKDEKEVGYDITRCY
jgi:hypothetical protein